MAQRGYHFVLVIDFSMAFSYHDYFVEVFDFLFASLDIHLDILDHLSSQTAHKDNSFWTTSHPEIEGPPCKTLEWNNPGGDYNLLTQCISLTSDFWTQLSAVIAELLSLGLPLEILESFIWQVQGVYWILPSS
jgi:hypothetical protein